MGGIQILRHVGYVLPVEQFRQESAGAPMASDNHVIFQSRRSVLLSAGLMAVPNLVAVLGSVALLRKLIHEFFNGP